MKTVFGMDKKTLHNMAGLIDSIMALPTVTKIVLLDFIFKYLKTSDQYNALPQEARQQMMLSWLLEMREWSSPTDAPDGATNVTEVKPTIDKEELENIVKNVTEHIRTIV